MSIISKQYDPAIGPIIQTTVSAPVNTSEGLVVNLLVDTEQLDLVFLVRLQIV